MPQSVYYNSLRPALHGVYRDSPPPPPSTATSPSPACTPPHAEPTMKSVFALRRGQHIPFLEGGAGVFFAFTRGCCCFNMPQVEPIAHSMFALRREHRLRPLFFSWRDKFFSTRERVLLHRRVHVCYSATALCTSDATTSSVYTHTRPWFQPRNTGLRAGWASASRCRALS